MFSRIKQDLPASIVVFLVALPLCLGIAVASGAPPVAGIIAGLVGGIVVGALSGSPLGVSGPAAGLTAIVAMGIAELGSFEALLAATVVAGLIQVGLGIARAGIIAYYFPSSVIKGMLAGIGVIIVLKQIPHALGDDKDPMGNESFDQPDKLNTFQEIWYAMESPNWGAVLIAIACVVLMVLWERPFIQRNQLLRYVPGPLLAVVLGIVMALGFDGHPMLTIGDGHYVQLPDLMETSSYKLPSWSSVSSPAFWRIAFTLAVVASIETLLCVEATDKMDPRKRITPANRELYAQGAGNIVSGLLGGLPLTQVVVRSSANIQSGGQTKASAILHGAWLLVSVLTVAGLLRMVPLASLAAVLLLVGYKLTKPALYSGMWKQGLPQFVPFIVTVGFMAVTNDLLRGVILGLVVAFIHILWKNFKVPYHFDARKYKPGMPVYITLSEDVTFLNKAGIKRTLSELPNGTRIVIDATRTINLDTDVREIIDDYVATSADRNIQVELVGFNNRSAMPKTNDLVSSVRSFAEAGRKQP
ncbi:MAG TPA: SulP family inorganic anion transporter [Flavobacteriales bacterium]|nr:SulP family inorganic anion transporter [Flavobacteriales bacterium]